MSLGEGKAVFARYPLLSDQDGDPGSWCWEPAFIISHSAPAANMWYVEIHILNPREGEEDPYRTVRLTSELRPIQLQARRCPQWPHSALEIEGQTSDATEVVTAETIPEFVVYRCRICELKWVAAA